MHVESSTELTLLSSTEYLCFISKKAKPTYILERLLLSFFLTRFKYYLLLCGDVVWFRRKKNYSSSMKLSRTGFVYYVWQTRSPFLENERNFLSIASNVPSSSTEFERMRTSLQLMSPKSSNPKQNNLVFVQIIFQKKSQCTIYVLCAGWTEASGPQCMAVLLCPLSAILSSSVGTERCVLAICEWTIVCC